VAMTSAICLLKLVIIVVKSVASCSVMSVWRVVISWLIVLVILVLMSAMIWSHNVLLGSCQIHSFGGRFGLRFLGFRAPGLGPFGLFLGEFRIFFCDKG